MRLFSLIQYDSTEIVVRNIYGKKVFKKSDFSRITALQSYVNIYIIEFKDGQRFAFGTGPLFIGQEAIKEAEKLGRELFGDQVA